MISKRQLCGGMTKESLSIVIIKWRHAYIHLSDYLWVKSSAASRRNIWGKKITVNERSLQN